MVTVGGIACDNAVCVVLADQEELFNPDSAIRVLMVDIKRRCKCNCSVGKSLTLMEHAFIYYTESIALFDEKTKSIVKIPDGPTSMEDAASYFTDRGTYILLKTDSESVAMATYVRHTLSANTYM